MYLTVFLMMLGISPLVRFIVLVIETSKTRLSAACEACQSKEKAKRSWLWRSTARTAIGALVAYNLHPLSDLGLIVVKDEVVHHLNTSSIGSVRHPRRMLGHDALSPCC
jgi:hypothetical protein